MNATWGAQWFFCNGDAWKALPPDIQAIVERNVLIYAKRQQRDNRLQNDSLADKLRREGLVFNTADRDTFKAKLAPWYVKQKAFYGQRLWSMLERYGNQLG
jgi:TRAP-type C4-dicarboxylate transport system substrate-binding protein